MTSTRRGEQVRAETTCRRRYTARQPQGRTATETTVTCTTTLRRTDARSRRMTGKQGRRELVLSLRHVGRWSWHPFRTEMPVVAAQVGHTARSRGQEDDVLPGSTWAGPSWGAAGKARRTGIMGGRHTGAKKTVRAKMSPWRRGTSAATEGARPRRGRAAAASRSEEPTHEQAPSELPTRAARELCNWQRRTRASSVGIRGCAAAVGLLGPPPPRCHGRRRARGTSHERAASLGRLSR